MSLRKQLLVAAIGLVICTLVASAAVLLSNSAQLQIEDQAVVVASSAARTRDQASMQRLVDSMAVGSIRLVRLVDASLAPLATSNEAETELTSADRVHLGAAMKAQRPETYPDAGVLKVAAPVVDTVGLTTGAALLTFPPDRIQTGIRSQVASAAPMIVIVLLAGIAIACGYVLVLTKPIARLDAAVAALGSYRFHAESLDDLAKRSNELGRMATLLQRMANAEQGWRRSLEGLRKAKDELELRVEERTRDLTVALDHQTALNTQLQEMGLGLQRSGDELRALAEVSRALVSTADAQQLLTTIITHAVRLSKSDAGTIYEFNDVQGTFVVRASDGIRPEMVARMHARREFGEAAIVGRAAMQRAPTQVADLWAEGVRGDALPEELDYRALLAVPLIQAGAVVGELVVRRKEPGDFEPETVALLQTIAIQSVLAVGPRVIQGDALSCGFDQRPRELVPADRGFARGALQQSVLHASRLAEFRKERLEAIRSNEGTVELSAVPKIVVHITPIGDFDTAASHDILPAVRYLAPFGRTISSQSVNFDGVMTCERGVEHCTAYAQGYWNGRIEMVDALLLTPWTDGTKRIPTRALEDSLIRTLELSHRYYEEIDIQPPFSIGLALLGVKGYRLAIDEAFWSELTNHLIDRADLVFPEIVVDDLAAPPHVTLRPFFDLLWNACGFQRCLDYEASGSWRPRG